MPALSSTVFPFSRSWFPWSFVALAENWVILGVFFYPALYYPLLACGTLHNKVGYVLGSFLSWTHFAVLVWQKIDCPKTTLVSKESFYAAWVFRIKTHKLVWSGPQGCVEVHMVGTLKMDSFLQYPHCQVCWTAQSPNNSFHCLLVLIRWLCHS